ALIGIVFFITQYFQEVLGYTALVSSLHTLPITVGMFVASPIVGRLIARWGLRLPMLLGTLLVGCGFFLLMSLTTTDDYADLWWKLSIVGIGFGFMLGPSGLAVLSAIPAKRGGLGSSIFDTSRQLGATLGVAVLGALVAQQFSGNIASKLAQQGVPKPISTTIADKIASAGPRASQLLSGGPLPLPPAVLRQTIGQAFVDAMKQTFLISTVALLTMALLIALLFRQKRHSSHPSPELLDLQGTTSARSMPHMVAVGAENSASQMNRSA